MIKRTAIVSESATDDSLSITVILTEEELHRCKHITIKHADESMTFNVPDYTSNAACTNISVN